MRRTRLVFVLWIALTSPLVAMSSDDEQIAPAGVINGLAAQDSQFPAIVSIQVEDIFGIYNHNCGGSIIQDNFVLTAAHCVNTLREDDMAVYDGDARQPPAGIGTYYGIEELRYHPAYNAATFVNDIAVLRVPGLRAVPSTSLASLETINSMAKNTLVTVAGWGRFNRINEQTSSQLLAADLFYLNHLDCDFEFRTRTFPTGLGIIGEWNVCAGNSVGVQSACHGDSGGPLYLQTQNSQEQIGIVSWGQPGQFGVGCGFFGEPGVFTNVGYYRDWISSTIADMTPINNTPEEQAPAIEPSGGSGSQCFIATAAYGSYLDPHVVTLRRFRDDVMLTNVLGERMVAFYYRHSPEFAEIIADSEILKSAVRILLTPIIAAIRSPLLMLMALVLIAAFAYQKRSARRNIESGTKSQT